MRPALKTALRRLWRDHTTLQLGITGPHAVVLSGLDPLQARWVDRLDGSRDRAEWLRGAVADGVEAAEAERLLAVLEDAGALADASRPLGLVGALPEQERQRLDPDLLALSLEHADPAEVMSARLRASVEVRGLGRVGTGIAALLAAAGVGRVVPVDPVAVRPSDLAPGGALGREVGLARERAARRAVARVAPQAATRPAAAPPGLVVLEQATAAVHAAQLLRDGVPHLVAGVVESTGVVGPLVLPGHSACARCLDLHRCDRDPAWPRLLAQQLTEAPAAACSVTLAALVSATAAAQALAWIDSGATAAATVNGTLELTTPDWRFRRRSWPPHPACGCGWHQGANDDTMTG